MRTWCFILLCWCLTATSVRGQYPEGENWPYQNYPDQQITVPSWRYAHGPHVRAAFRKVVANARGATVEVQSDGRRVALGGVVDPRGWVLTKASALEGKVTCVFADGREYEASETARDSKYDLALLKVKADNLAALEFSDEMQLGVGSWVATVGQDSYPEGVGVVSVESREIEHQAGVLGVALDPTNEAARILRVFPGSAASRAGLLINDVLLSINDKPTASRRELIEQIRRYNPGDSVEIKVDRNGRQVEVSAILMGRFPTLPPTRAEFQNQLGGGLSERRFGFPSAFQHDSPIDPDDCGGPLVDLSGKVVGFNLARSGRTESYAIGVEALAKVLATLLPADLNLPREAAEKISAESSPAGVSPLVSPTGPAVR